ncbi:hypothetical protein RESH_02590 [Rhodopirellula europaea SH398]|uniref:Uncharacterized protein n=1 Tax=Rhodopirellula europaea SH398 TaxID=1263868 RepID=M5SG74_9BACT|nr:hypothetical protein RESH_02590 [Rhodopirellula europaea SH398]
MAQALQHRWQNRRRTSNPSSTDGGTAERGVAAHSRSDLNRDPVGLNKHCLLSINFP